MCYCKPNNAKEWRKLRHFFDVRNMIRLRNRGQLCIFITNPFPYIIDAEPDTVYLGDDEPMSVDDFICAVGKIKTDEHSDLSTK